MYKPTKNENIICTIIPRQDNTIDTPQEDIALKKFKCRIINNTTIKDNNVYNTMLSRQCSLAIYATHCPYEIKERDTLEINKKKYLVDSIEIDQLALDLLFNNDFSVEYLERQAPKTIYLK